MIRELVGEKILEIMQNNPDRSVPITGPPSKSFWNNSWKSSLYVPVLLADSELLLTVHHLDATGSGFVHEGGDCYYPERDLAFNPVNVKAFSDDVDRVFAQNTSWLVSSSGWWWNLPHRHKASRTLQSASADEAENYILSRSEAEHWSHRIFQRFMMIPASIFLLCSSSKASLSICFPLPCKMITENWLQRGAWFCHDLHWKWRNGKAQYGTVYGSHRQAPAQNSSSATAHWYCIWSIHWQYKVPYHSPCSNQFLHIYLLPNPLKKENLYIISTVFLIQT